MTSRRRHVRHYHELEWDRLGVVVPPDTYRRFRPTGYLWMLAEDVGTELWWHFHRMAETGSEDAVCLRGATEETTDLVCDAFSRDSYADDFRSILGHFCQMAAHEIISQGKALCEVIIGRNCDDAPGQIEAADLLWLPTELMTKRRTVYVENIPSDVAERDKCAAQLEIPVEKVLRLTSPKKWCHSLDSIRQCLPTLEASRHGWTRDRIESMGAGRENGLEDFTSVMRSYGAAMARICAPIGWSGRGLWQEHMASYQSSVWQLRWYEFCIELRDSIIDAARRGIDIIAEAQGEQVELICDAVPSLADVQEARHRLRSGENSFSEILAAFSK